MVVVNGYRLLIEPPSYLSWFLGGMLMFVGVVLPAVYVMLRKRNLFGLSVDVTKLV